MPGLIESCHNKAPVIYEQVVRLLAFHGLNLIECSIKDNTHARRDFLSYIRDHESDSQEVTRIYQIDGEPDHVVSYKLPRIRLLGITPPYAVAQNMITRLFHLGNEIKDPKTTLDRLEEIVKNPPEMNPFKISHERKRDKAVRSQVDFLKWIKGYVKLRDEVRDELLT